MPIKTTCPRCDADFNLADSLRGKRIRCTKCCHVFVVGGGDGEGDVQDVEPVGIQHQPAAKPPRRLRDEMNDPHRPSLPRRDERANEVLMYVLVRVGIVFGIFAVLTLPMVCCIGIFFFGWFGIFAAAGAANVAQMPGGPMQAQKPAFPKEQTMTLCIHVKDRARWPGIRAKLEKMTDAPNPDLPVTISGDFYWVTLAPVRADTNTFSRKIDFGKITALHADQRLIYVEPD